MSKERSKIKSLETTDMERQPKSRKTLHKSILLCAAVVILSFAGILYWLNCYTNPESFVSTEAISQAFDIVESDGGVYFGPLIETLYTGEGEFFYLAGGVYTGEFEDSMRNGNGTFTWENGDTFTGEWKSDNMVTGTYTFANGISYNGSLSTDNNRKTFQDGTLMLNDVGQAYGFSDFKAAISKGSIQEISYTLLDGKKYKGLLTGYATITYSSGNTYAGSVRSGERHGDGLFTWKDSAGKTVASYDGNWELGVMSGTGTYHYSNSKYPYITGKFVNGKPDGTLTYYKEAGNAFKTTWSNGVCTKVEEA